jgi:hypothetical protein
VLLGLNLPLTREFRHALLSCYATLRLLAELPRIDRHRRVVRTHGPPLIEPAPQTQCPARIAP